LNAVCMSCGRPACRTQRLMAGDERVVIGGSEAYEARCLMCYDPTLSGG
jgi:thymidine kinase